MRHRERAAVLLGLWLASALLLASCGPAATPTAVPTPIPTPTDPPTPTPAWPPLPALSPPHVLAPEWDGAEIDAICVSLIEVGDPLGLAEKMTEVVRRILTDVGLHPGAEGEACDATLTISLEGTPVSRRYEGLGDCYTGATIEGEMTLAAPGLETLTLPITWNNPVEGVIISREGDTPACQREPGPALYSAIWQRGLLNRLIALWGPRLLVPALWDADKEIVEAARSALRTYGADEEVVSFLIHLLADSRGWMRALAAESLGEIGPPAREAIPYLIHVVAVSDSDVAAEALEALAAIALEDLGADAAAWADWWEEASPRMAALEESALDAAALAVALSDAATLVAFTAAEKLAHMGPDAPEAVPALISALGRDSVALRRQAAIALGGAGSDAIPGLIQALGDEDEAVVTAAAEQLAAMGPDAMEAVPALVGRLHLFRGGPFVPACYRALLAITGQDFGVDAGDRWLDWWDEAQ